MTIVLFPASMLLLSVSLGGVLVEYYTRRHIYAIRPTSDVDRIERGWVWFGRRWRWLLPAALAGISISVATWIFDPSTTDPSPTGGTASEPAPANAANPVLEDPLGSAARALDVFRVRYPETTTSEFGTAVVALCANVTTGQDRYAGAQEWLDSSNDLPSDSLDTAEQWQFALRQLEIHDGC